MGQLIYKYGTVGASKTANALMLKYQYEEKGFKTLLINPSVNDRDGDGIIKSRIGLEAKAKSPKELVKVDTGDYDLIIVDEAQFLKQGDVVLLRILADSYDVDVICYGLRNDFKTHLFEGSKYLMAHADKIEEIESICWCGNKAIYNARIKDNKMITYGEVIEVGYNYVPLCSKHFNGMNISKD